MAPNGTLARQTDRVFARPAAGAEPGVPGTALKVDVAGNVVTGGGFGRALHPSMPRARKLWGSASSTEQPATTNLGFGGDDWKGTLFFHEPACHLGSVNTQNRPGIPGGRFRQRKA